MRYQKVLNLWAPGIQDKILSGEIQLQRGQWLVCGESEKLCRYVSHTERSINVVHWQGSGRATQSLFYGRIHSLRLQKIYEEERAAAWRAAVDLEKGRAA